VGRLDDQVLVGIQHLFLCLVPPAAQPKHATLSRTHTHGVRRRGVILLVTNERDVHVYLCRLSPQNEHHMREFVEFLDHRVGELFPPLLAMGVSLVSSHRQHVVEKKHALQQTPQLQHTHTHTSDLCVARRHHTHMTRGSIAHRSQHTTRTKHTPVGATPTNNSRQQNINHHTPHTRTCFAQHSKDPC